MGMSHALAAECENELRDNIADRLEKILSEHWSESDYDLIFPLGQDIEKFIIELRKIRSYE